MARLPRLYIPGLPQIFQLQGSRWPLAVDDADYDTLVRQLKAALAQQRCQLYAYGASSERLGGVLLAPTADALGRALQSLGRSYVARYNQRHGRAGPLWAGRYRSTVLAEHEYLLDAMRYVEVSAPATEWSSAPHHVGIKSDPTLADPSVYWQLGNEPFERQAAYQALLSEPLSAARTATIERCLRGGWLLGGEASDQTTADLASRRIKPAMRGRPKKPVPI